jgi:transcription elongation factor Elf1
MLESTDLSVQEVQDNIDVYGTWINETDVDEYSKAFNNQSK